MASISPTCLSVSKTIRLVHFKCSYLDFLELLFHLDIPSMEKLPVAFYFIVVLIFVWRTLHFAHANTAGCKRVPVLFYCENKAAFVSFVVSYWTNHWCIFFDYSSTLSLRRLQQFSVKIHHHDFILCTMFVLWTSCSSNSLNS